MLKDWHRPKHSRYFDLNKQAKTLAFKHRHKLIKESLLTYYGSFEEMALCGVEGYGKTGYSIPVNTFLEREYGNSTYMAFCGLAYWRSVDPVELESIQDLLEMIDRRYLSKERLYFEC